MKFSIDRIGENGDLVFEVDTHDRHLSPELVSERLRKTQEQNEELKVIIERAWDLMQAPEPPN